MLSLSKRQALWLHRWMWGGGCSPLRELAVRNPLLLKSGGLPDLYKSLLEVDCELKLGATNTVFGEGRSDHPDLMIVGEAPGAEEDRQGRPFVGRSGKLLERMLEAVRISRSDIYITNIIPWRPPGNRTPTKEEVSLMLPYVLRHIELIKPQMLLLLGSTAARSILGDQNTPMSRLTHQWYEVNGVRAIATYHPSYLLRVPTKKGEAWDTMVKVKMWLEKATTC